MNGWITLDYTQLRKTATWADPNYLKAYLYMCIVADASGNAELSLTERELAARFSWSRRRVRKLIETLVSDGLVQQTGSVGERLLLTAFNDAQTMLDVREMKTKPTAKTISQVAETTKLKKLRFGRWVYLTEAEARKRQQRLGAEVFDCCVRKIDAWVNVAVADTELAKRRAIQARTADALFDYWVIAAVRRDRAYVGTGTSGYKTARERSYDMLRQAAFGETDDETRNSTVIDVDAIAFSKSGPDNEGGD